MAYQIPINQCLMLAERKLMDAAYIRHTQPRRAADADHVEAEAREFLEIAQRQGWTGDIDARITAILASELCKFA